jgi:Uma2 family endonuclease
LGEYEDDTPGASALTNTSNIVDKQNEPQPDVCLLIEAECGGQTRIRRGWLIGAPELIAEVASSSESYDLHAKKESYERAGVKEYVVVALRQRRVFWFISQRGKFCELQPGNDGIFRSQVFPGLWLDPVALLKHQRKRVLAVLRRGLATPEHKAFVKMLAAKRKGRKP